MKQFEKDLKIIIDEIDNSKSYPHEKDIKEKISRDSYNYLLVRELIECRHFLDKPEAPCEIRVTQYGYSYFLNRKYIRQTYRNNLIISIIISALSGIASSALFYFIA